MTDPDTIVAISTPRGESGVGMVRLSGPQAISIGQKVFNSNPPLGKRLRRLEYGRMLDVEGREIDTGLAWAFRGPHSYTGEDTVEISCHGSPIVLETLVHAAIALGAILAGPGEFTRRAFLNGHLDLIQAEAVLEVIKAENRGVLSMAYKHVSGRLSECIKYMKGRIISALSLIEIGLDFSEEGIEEIGRDQIINEIHQALELSRSLADTFEGCRRRQQGYMVALVGRPNVGKSTLLNALLGEDKAIVTPVPGTTRDLVEGKVIWRGDTIRLVDTAGIQNTEDLVEQEGIKRSHTVASKAEVVLGIVDASSPWQNEDDEVVALLKYKPGILVLNKIDLPWNIEIPEYYTSNFMQIDISALTGKGLDVLKGKIMEVIPRPPLLDGVGITQQRHQEKLLRICACLETAKDIIMTKNSLAECVAVELQEALFSLGEILGENVGDEVLDRVFSEFCIGK